MLFISPEEPAEELDHRNDTDRDFEKTEISQNSGY